MRFDRLVEGKSTQETEKLSNDKRDLTTIVLKATKKQSIKSAHEERTLTKTKIHE